MPIINSKDQLVALVTKTDWKKSREFPNSSDDKHGRLLVGAAVKFDRNTKKTIRLLVEAGVNVLLLEAFEDFMDQLAILKWIKENHKGVDVIAGNVVTDRQAKRLIDVGADAIRMGFNGVF